EALGHSFGNWETTQEPTVYAQGERTRSCERCDYAETASIPKLEPEPEPEPEPQQETMVWISGSGSKYHSNSSCSGMKNPSRVPISQAEAAGRSPCKKCY
ncbi:MAG: hypothetical protein II328_00175, partial [Clostridia bacterium]|nr:hypothetical protein [Clostridia bacterium]